MQKIPRFPPLPKIDILPEPATTKPAQKEKIDTLPKVIYCPVCGEKMVFLSLTPQEAQGARASGAVQAAKLQSACGTTAVLALRIHQGLHIYSLTFWIVPKTQITNDVLSKKEQSTWKIDIGQNKHGIDIN